MKGKAYTEYFAKIYDDIMSTVPYDFWYNYLHELLGYYQKKPAKVLDLACGTGNMSLRFAENGYQVIGVDGSREMLEIAKSKAKSKGTEMVLDFVQADLRGFQLSQRFDLAISLFDSLNYILELNDLKKVFRNVYMALKKGGIFIFDMNTSKRLMSIKPGITILNGENYTCFWEDKIDQVKRNWQVRLKIYLDKDKVNVFEEFHEETGYMIKEIASALVEVGFQYVDVYNAYTFDQGNDDDNRLYFIAIKDLFYLKKN